MDSMGFLRASNPAFCIFSCFDFKTLRYEEGSEYIEAETMHFVLLI
jgi:hypothetical protein